MSIGPHMLRERSRPRGERGFTMVELLVVLIIMMVLMVVAWAAIHEARRTSRAKAMSTAAATTAQALSAFNRMRPPITTDAMISATTWTSTQSEAAGGLYSITGERLLDPWPTNPYDGKPITITRVAACPAMPAIGQVIVCRLPATAKRADFRVIAGAQNKSGTAYVVYDASFG